MSKILLVYDDFAELNATELSLKKVAFDVIGLTNEYTVKDQIIAFNPDIVVALGNSQRVSSLSVGKKIKEMTRWPGKSILIFPKDFVIPTEDLIRMRMDMLLETPVSVIRLIQIICKLLKQDEKAVLEKLAKSFAKDRADDTAFAAFDSETVKVIQHIQGELENLDSSELQSLPPSEIEKSEVKSTATKKSFFEKEEAAVAVDNGDPFAALISELKGEPSEKPAVKSLENAPVKKETVVSLTAEPKANDAAEATVTDLSKLGQKLKQEIKESSAQLSEKIKKYTKLSSGLDLYPESTIKKTKAKQALKRMKEGWDANELAKQDVSRREFVDRLFGSKKDKK